MSDDRYQADSEGQGLEVTVKSAQVKISSEVIEAFLSQVDKLCVPTNDEEYLRITKVRKSSRSVAFFIYDSMKFVIENREYVFQLVDTYLQYLGGMLVGNEQPVTKEQVEERIMELLASVRRRSSGGFEISVHSAALLLIPIRRIAIGTLKNSIREAIVSIRGKEYIISIDKIPEKVKQELRTESEREWIRSIRKSFLGR